MEITQNANQYYFAGILPNKETDPLLANQRKAELQEKKTVYKWLTNDGNLPGCLTYDDQILDLPADIQFDASKIGQVLSDVLISRTAEGEGFLKLNTLENTHYFIMIKETNNKNAITHVFCNHL